MNAPVNTYALLASFWEELMSFIKSNMGIRNKC